METSRRFGDKTTEATILGNLATIRRQLGDQASALLLHERSLEIKRRLGDRPGEAELLNDIGADQHAIGDNVASLRSHMQALQISQEIGGRHEEARAPVGVADAMESDPETLEASSEIIHDHLRRAQAIFTEQGTPDVIQIGDRLAKSTYE